MYKVKISKQYRVASDAHIRGRTYGVCLSMSGLFHLTWWPLVSSTWLPRRGCHFLFFFNGWIVSMCITFPSSIHLMMDTLLGSISWLSWTVLQYIWWGRNSFDTKHSILLGKYPVVGLLDHTSHTILCGTSLHFYPQWLRAAPSPHPHQHLWLSSLIPAMQKQVGWYLIMSCAVFPSWLLRSCSSLTRVCSLYFVVIWCTVFNLGSGFTAWSQTTWCFSASISSSLTIINIISNLRGFP